LNEYSFPEVFLENISSDKYYIVEKNNEYILTDKLEKYTGYKRFFGHIIYEDILNYIDLTKPLITKSLIIIPRFNPEEEMKGLLVEKNTSVCLIEVKGVQPYVFPRESDFIEENEKIAYIVTGKGEVRVIKSPCKGIVLLIINLPWEKPEKYILVVVDRDAARQITIRKG
jgi:hypothetical protein